MHANQRSNRLFLLLAFLTVTYASWCQSAVTIPTAKQGTLRSAILGEQRSFFISLPVSYEHDEFYPNKRYPVMILLDADAHFSYASSMIHFLSEGSSEQIPEMIVVAVRNTNRTRDMTSDLSQTSPFRAFLEKELLLYIDQHYRTLPYRLMVGHSLAGLFTLNCLLDKSSFNAYIAIDPTLTWNNGYLLPKANRIFQAEPALQAKLYLTQSANPFAPGQHTGDRGKAFDTFTMTLAKSRSQLPYRFTYYDQETHFSVPFRSLYDGLMYVFEGYQFPFQTFFGQGKSGLSDHYKQLFAQWSVNVLPPGKVINQAGLFLLNNKKDVDKAIDLFRLNVDYYPTSPAAYRSLGEAYRAKGDKALALASYKKVLELHSADEKAKQVIQELTNPK